MDKAESVSWARASKLSGHFMTWCALNRIIRRQRTGAVLYGKCDSPHKDSFQRCGRTCGPDTGTTFDFHPCTHILQASHGAGVSSARQHISQEPSFTRKRRLQGVSSEGVIQHEVDSAPANEVHVHPMYTYIYMVYVHLCVYLT